MKSINLYNAAVAEYNEWINDFNEFIHYWNKQFTPAKTDSAIQTMVDVPCNKLKDAKNKLAQISNPDANTTNLISQT